MLRLLTMAVITLLTLSLAGCGTIHTYGGIEADHYWDADGGYYRPGPPKKHKKPKKPKKHKKHKQHHHHDDSAVPEPFEK